MNISISLSENERAALWRLASETGTNPDAAAHIALREFLISVGFLEPAQELDYDTATEGTA